MEHRETPRHALAASPRRIPLPAWLPALASNKTGVVNAIDQFSANFAKSADLLNDDGNFIHNAMDNRSRAISYIENNKTSLQAEFGTGATASATGQVAQALAAYEKAHSTT